MAVSSGATPLGPPGRLRILSNDRTRVPGRRSFQWHPDKCPGSCGLVLPPPPPEACTSACTSGCSEDQCNARMAEVSTANRGPPL